LGHLTSKQVTAGGFDEAKGVMYEL
jgi:hypothetical protein